MIDVDAPTLAAQGALEIIPRSFMWITARNIATGLLESAGFWNDVGTYDFEVLDGNTWLPVTRTYTGSGTLIKLSDTARTIDLTIREAKVKLTTSPIIENLLRGYDLKSAPCEVHRGYLNTVSRNLVAPPIPRFVGWVDDVRIVTPEESETAEGYAELKLVSITRELTRASAEKRSHESQLLRDPTDDFFVDCEVVGSWITPWGTSSGRLATTIIDGPPGRRRTRIVQE